MVKKSLKITSRNHLLLLSENVFTCPDFKFKMYQTDYLSHGREVFTTMSPFFSTNIPFFASSFLSVFLSFLFFAFFAVEGEILYTKETNYIIGNSSFNQNTSLQVLHRNNKVFCEMVSPKQQKTYLLHIIFRLRKLHP